ncbi:unnamed protein product [Macrosiphum euphorbiae]|uniref:Uncharacterized protein n=1 Tax=Macrosiphum euphorbiae TaxID=13131 RepID=A0AAV0XYM5_9HEMI|nr:unnamed protein product [Macrosiphum euphorbiae]
MYPRNTYRRSGVLAKGSGPLHGAAVARRTPRSPVRAARLPVPGFVQEQREPDVRQQPGRVFGPVAVPPWQHRLLVVVAPARRLRRRVNAVQPGHVAQPFVVLVATPEPPSVVCRLRRHYRSARFQAAGTEQGGARLLAVPHQALPSTVRHTYILLYVMHTAA